MKNLSFIILVVLISSVSFFSSCNKATDLIAGNCSANWTTEVTDEFSALGTTSAAYGNDQSAANCTAYKAAMKKYIDALKSLSSCTLIVGASKTAFNEALKEAEDDIKTLC